VSVCPSYLGPKSRKKLVEISHFEKIFPLTFVTFPLLVTQAKTEGHFLIGDALFYYTQHLQVLRAVTLAAPCVYVTVSQTS